MIAEKRDTAPDPTLEPGTDPAAELAALRRENRQLRQALAAADPRRARQADLFREAPAGLLEMGADGTILEANLAAEALLGLDAGAWAGQRLGRYLHPDDRAAGEAFRRRLLETGAAAGTELRMVRADGTPFWAELHAAVTVADDGAPRFRIAVTDDTERRRALEILSASEARVRSLNGHLVSGMVYQIVAKSGGERTFSYLSDAVTRLYGITPEAGMADPSLIYGRVHPEDRERLMREEEEARLSLSTFRTDARMIGPDGGVRWSSFVSCPTRIDDEATCWDGIEFDVTEHKRVEEALRESRRDLANYHEIITHDLSNFSMKLMGTLELVLSGAVGDLAPLQREFLRKANRQVLELEKLAANSRLLSRIDETGRLDRVTPRSLSEIATAALDGARAIHFDREVDAELSMPADLGAVAVPFLDQVLLNLVDNAIRYTPPRQPARLAIAARRTGGGERLEVSVLGGRLVDPAFVGRMFDRYVRGAGSRGSGLGLAASREIVRVAGGTISARAVESGDGPPLCEVRLELPAA